MTAPRTFSALRLWVLAWFMASLGVAVASPIVHPQSIVAQQPSLQLRARWRRHASPITSICTVHSMASGVVVSRTSPGGTSFSAGSVRFRRVWVSPSPRSHAVRPARPALPAQQQVGRGVVAQHHGGFAQLGHRHALPVCMRLGPRRVFHQAAVAEAHTRVQALALRVRQYWLCRLKSRPPTAALQAFRAWLLRETTWPTDAAPPHTGPMARLKTMPLTLDAARRFRLAA